MTAFLHEKEFSRKSFLKGGGAMLVGFSFAGGALASGKAITTLEGLPALWAKERGTTAASPALHPLQQAWIDVQVPHCGYCQNGMMIQAADLLSTTKNPTEDQIRTAMNGHLCRCGTYPRILTAIKQAASVMAKGGK